MPESVARSRFMPGLGLEEGGFATHSQRLESVLNGTWTTSSEPSASWGL